jgi:hypothetical protein
MSHVYQPMLLRTLIQGNGRASLRDIAAAFLALDEAQLEYYKEITKRMPGPALRGHGLVELLPFRSSAISDRHACLAEALKRTSLMQRS